MKGKHFQKLKSSLKLKLMIVIVIITLLTILVAWLTCSLLIERFYVDHAKSNLVQTYESCNTFFSDELNVRHLDDSSSGSINEYVDNPGQVSIFIMDPDNFRVYNSVSINQRVARGIQSIIQNFDFSVFDNAGVKYKIIQNTVTKDESPEPADFCPTGTDAPEVPEDEKFLTGSYYDLVGKLNNGFIIVLRSPVERIHREIDFASKLYFLFALMLICVEMLLVMFISNQFTSPIVQMSRAARKMSDLDFSVKIPVKTCDEIGDLAGSMNEMSDKLEKTVSELQAANLQLSRDIEKRDHMEEMRSEFLSHVSHELKTPIALIQGYSEGLKDGVTDDPESVNYYLDVIIDEAGKMNALVMKLIDLNELEFGEDKLTIERFDITELIRDVINAEKILIEKAEARVTFDETAPQYVWADEFMIEEVITNYLTNAIHYVKRGGNIRIWTEQRGENLRISVYDQGDRIADKDIDKVFIKFYKADPARTRSYGGSGIGLSIVAAIMKSHCKPYGVYNTEDGVVFYIELDTTGSIRKEMEAKIGKSEDGSQHAAGTDETE